MLSHAIVSPRVLAIELACVTQDRPCCSAASLVGPVSITPETCTTDGESMTTRTNDVALLAARLAVAALFLPAGIGKLSGLSGFTAMLARKGVPYPDLLAMLGVAAEILGPIALI